MSDIVVLAAHGAGDGSEGNRRIVRLAEYLRLKRSEAFRPAFWKGTPRFEDAARSLAGRHALFVPIMTGGERHAARLLPDRLALGDPGRSWVLTHPLGALPSFTGVVLDLVGEALARMLPVDGDPVVLVVAPGDSRASSNGEVTGKALVALSATYPRADVYAAFLDGPPHLHEMARFLMDRPLVVMPLLMGEDPTLQEDLGRSVGAESRRVRGVPTEVLPPVLRWPQLATLTLEAVDAALRARLLAAPGASL